MQKTNFRFEAVVHDDVSTDRSAEIIREYAEKYPDIIKPIYETENQYSKHDGSLQTIMNKACKGKYLAFCEGDDYWTDPLKLQKQVDFLEEHPDYSMCFTDVRDFYSDKQIWGPKQSVQYGRMNASLINSYEDSFYKILLCQCRIQTLSVLLRTELYKACIPSEYQFLMGDTLMWLDLSQKGKIHYINECMGVYNVHPGSMCRNSDTIYRFQLSMYEMRVYYCNKYNYSIPLRIKKSYNRSYVKFLLYDKKGKRNPLYEAFDIDTINDKIFKKFIKKRKNKWLVKIVFFLEDIISVLKGYCTRNVFGNCC